MRQRQRYGLRIATEILRITRTLLKCYIARFRRLGAKKTAPSRQKLRRLGDYQAFRSIPLDILLSYGIDRMPVTVAGSASNVPDRASGAGKSQTRKGGGQ
jgi:hypothetical protein